MTNWVHSVHRTAPFYVSSNNYTKIAVDRVQAADQQMYNILLLATGMFQSGRIPLFLFLPALFSCLYLMCFPVDLACNRALSIISVRNNGLKIYQSQYSNASKCCLCAVPTDSGKIHKVLEAGSEPFIISETQLSSRSAIQSMQLDSKKVQLI